MSEIKQGRIPLRIILGIVISLVALAVLIWISDVNQVLTYLRSIRLTTILPVMLLLVISLLTRSAAWRIILKRRVSLWKAFQIINAGYFVNTVLPFRMGELSRAVLLLPSGFSFWEALPTILLERLFDIGFVLILFIMTLPFALNFSQGVGFIYLLAGLVIAGLIVLFLLVRYQERVIKLINGIAFLRNGVKNRLVSLVKAVVGSLTILSDPLNLVKVFLGMLISWIVALIIQYILLRAFIPEAKLIWAAFALSAVSLGVSIPSSPGNIGVYEASITLALSAFGIDQSLAFSYALISHLLSLILTTVLGSYSLVNEGYRLRDIWRLSRDQRKENIS
jgi:uncharacterized protein (TIRG00374 family)